MHILACVLVPKHNFNSEPRSIKYRGSINYRGSIFHAIYHTRKCINNTGTPSLCYNASQPDTSSPYQTDQQNSMCFITIMI